MRRSMRVGRFLRFGKSWGLPAHEPPIGKQRSCYSTSFTAMNESCNRSTSSPLAFAFLVLCFVVSPAVSADSEDLYQKAIRLFQDGKSAEALSTAKRALAEAEDRCGAENLELSKHITLLSDIHRKREEWAEASDYLERLQSIQEGAWGVRDTKIARTVSTLISLYEKQGDQQKAQDLNNLASKRWGAGVGRPSNTAPTRQNSEEDTPKDPLLEKWRVLSENSNYSKITALLADYQKNHKYLKEDFFVCSDMAIEVWDVIKTAGIEARLMVGNVTKDIVKYQSTHEYIAQMNHVWVMAELIPSEWVPIEPTVGMIVHPKIPVFNLYHQGTSFKNPRQFKEFSESRTALFEACKEAQTMVTDLKRSHTKKPVTVEALVGVGKAKQKVEDCENLEKKVVSYLRN